MKILITNDDGVDAEGINVLHETLSARHEAYIIAPDAERSACSNAITVRDPMTIKKLSPDRYALSGFPADCVSVGMHGGIIPVPDMVLSGINHGPNVGEDLFFSGTVAGARTAYIFGTAGIAVSINAYRPDGRLLRDAAEFILGLLDSLGPGGGAGTRAFLNVNYPHIPLREIRGVRHTFAGRRIYRDSFSRTETSADEAVLHISGMVDSVPRAGSDITELENGYISISPLQTDCTDFDALEKMRAAAAQGPGAN